MKKLFMTCLGCACMLMASSVMANNSQTQNVNGSEKERQDMLLMIKALMQLGPQGENAKNQIVQQYISIYGFEQLPDQSFDNLDPDGTGDLLIPGIGVDEWENGGNIDIEFN